MLFAQRVNAWRDADAVRAATGHLPPADGLHYRWPDLPSLRIESRLHDKLAAVRAFAQRELDRPRRHRVAAGHASASSPAARRTTT